MKENRNNNKIHIKKNIYMYNIVDYLATKKEITGEIDIYDRLSLEIFEDILKSQLDDYNN